MAITDPVSECRCKVQNVQIAAKSVIFDEFQNLYLLENYLECLTESQRAVKRMIRLTKAKELNNSVIAGTVVRKDG
jgi:hypothetical protein